MAKTGWNGTRHWTPESRQKIRRARKLQRPPAVKHGAYSALRAVTGGRIDRRTTLGRAVAQLRHDLIEDLGGPKKVTTGQRLLIDRVVANAVFVQTVEQHALADGSLLDGQGQVFPALGRFYNAACNRLRLDLMALGLQRKGREPKSIHDLLAESTEGDLDGQGIAPPASQGASGREISRGVEEDPGDGN